MTTVADERPGTTGTGCRAEVGPGGGAAAALREQFRPRPAITDWPVTRQPRELILARLQAAPFLTGGAHTRSLQKAGLAMVLDWLEQFPGHSWQQRWLASGADDAANTAWKDSVRGWLTATGGGSVAAKRDRDAATAGAMILTCADVIRPGLGWLLRPGTPKNLAARMATCRDPRGWTALREQTDRDPAGRATKATGTARIAVIMATKGGLVGDITVGDCLELLDTVHAIGGGKTTSAFFYQLLHAIEVFPAAAPPTVRALSSHGQHSIEQLVDRYSITCRPVRDLLVDYLRERQPTVDYVTLQRLASTLGKLFWADLERHHPGIASLQLAPEVAAAWKQRTLTKTITTRTPGGGSVETTVPRSSGLNTLATVRAFYLDIAQWAMADPARWGPWAAPSPIRAAEMSRKKEHRHRKSRMDQRTRDRLPVLPRLIASVDTERTTAAAVLGAAQATPPGQTFNAAGQTLRRAVLARPDEAVRTWADEPDTGVHRDLTTEERRAFWAWAAVEVLRHTGIRIEELTELSHHSFVQYTLPSTGELIPLLHIAPSKTDSERLLVISPELADVLSAIVCRIRSTGGAVPLVSAYDYHERVWNRPMPLLFQRHYGGEPRPITPPAIRRLLDHALTRTGLVDASRQPLRFLPHDFRRIFITDAVLNGMPPHIAQLVVGHGDINTTMGYKAVYPEEVINGHRAFIARRRALRPGEEYRTPTEQEWEEFLGHFERRKVAVGTCGRAYATPCSHEHACLRCPLLRPDPTQRGRLVEIRDNLLARIDEAQQEGWLGEVEGLKISLAGAEHKLAQLDELATRATTVHLGIPRVSDLVGRAVTTTPSRP